MKENNPVRLQEYKIEELRKIARQTNSQRDWNNVLREYFKLGYIKEEYENEVGRKIGVSKYQSYVGKVFGRRDECDDASD